MDRIDIKTLHTFDTQYSACSVEWCPHPNFLTLFACGTYLYDESSQPLTDTQRRKGLIYLYRFNSRHNDIEKLHALTVPAVLDMKWIKQEDLEIPLLATAFSNGQIAIYMVRNNNLVLRNTCDLKKEVANFMVLSVDCNWSSDIRHICKLLVTDSTGDVSLLCYDGSRLEIQERWNSHTFEGWICAFDKWDPSIAYSGGDDTFLNVFDIRVPRKIVTNRSHHAGVTSILSYPKKERILLTGSYDEHMRVFDTRFMRSTLYEIDLKGGVWRIKADPGGQNFLLAACMYKNFSVVHCEPETCELKLVGEYTAHESICYGADWCLDVPEGPVSELYMATCSFFDRKLCVSKISTGDV